jgi:hypothetical protein
MVLIFVYYVFDRGEQIHRDLLRGGVPNSYGSCSFENIVTVARQVWISRGSIEAFKLGTC